MVFCNTRRNVDLISNNLRRYKIYSHAIHGGLDQKKRSRIIEQFHENKADVLVCTDVAARGLDIKGITHVYNYDTPKTSEEYIHRIGRTARAGKKGMAISIVSQRDYDNFRNVMQDDSLKIEKVEVPEVEKLNPDFQDRGRERSGFGGRRDSRGPRKGNYSGGRRDSGRRSSGERGYSGGFSGRRDSRGGRSGGRPSGKRHSSGRTQRGGKPGQGRRGRR